MGTSYSIKIRGEINLARFDSLKNGINEELKKINQIMSTWIKDSELSKLNQSPVGQWITLSNELFEVIQSAKNIYKLSDGSFDVTVGPLVNLWGFGPKPGKRKIPSASEINSLLKVLGTNHIQLDSKNKRLKKVKAISIDLSAIAKGYGVDRLSNYLSKNRVKNFIAEIGGEIHASGYREFASKGGVITCKPWRIAIEAPLVDSREVQQIVELSNISIATSGDYRNYYEKNGSRFSHTINPRSGYPIKHNLASVSVKHKLTMQADALATALMVMGARKGVKFVNKHDIAALFIVKAERGFKVIYSKTFNSNARISCTE